MAVVGRIARAHGIRGQVIVNPETDFPDERFQPGAEVFVERGGRVEPLTITTARFHRPRPVVGIDGFDTMTAAETLAGLNYGCRSIARRAAAGDVLPARHRLPRRNARRRQVMVRDVEGTMTGAGLP